MFRLTVGLEDEGTLVLGQTIKFAKRGSGTHNGQDNIDVQKVKERHAKAVAVNPSL